MRVKIEQRGIYETLVSQLDRIARTTDREVSIRSVGIMKLRSGSVPILRMSIVCKNFPMSEESIWSAM